MADKIFNVRIRNKYDSYENWRDSSLVLEEGEIAIAYTTVDVTLDNGTIEQHPALLMKVGDGEKTFANLPWMSAKAADVPAWAKAAVKPTYEAKEITGMEQYIANYVETEMGISVDTDTQYQIVKVDDYNYKLQSKGKSDEAWADVANSTIVIPNDTAAIEALEELVGDTAVATQIANAITELDLANTYEAKGEAAKVQTALDEYKETNDAAVDANADAIAAIKDGTNIDSFADVETALAGKQAAGDYATKAEAQGYADAKDEAIAAAKQAGDDAQAAVDALGAKVGEVAEGKTVVGMIAEAQTAATYDDTEVKADIAALEGLVGDTEVSTQISTAVAAEAEIARAAEKANADAIDAIEADYLKGADKTELQGNIDALANGAVKANTEAIAKLNGDDKTEGSIDYKVAQEVAKILNDNDTDDIDTLEEIAAWIKNDTAGVGDLNRRVTDNTNAITTLNGDATTDGSVAKKIADAIAAKNLDQYATDTELEALAGRVTTAEGEIDTLQSDLDTAEAAIDVLEGKVGDKAVSEQITDVTNPLAGRVSTLEGEMDAAEGKIATLETEVAKKANDADLKAVAKSGLIDDLSIGEGTTLIFDCGSSEI